MDGKELLHYRILEKLGQGGMGEVYAAEDTRLSRTIALKILPDEMAKHPERKARFEREAKAIAALNHPNIVTIHSVEESDGTHFITMELVEGRTLRQIVPDTGLPASKIFELAIPMSDAIAAAHAKGITHRDLKPDNVMVTTEGRVKVLDFGLAKLFDPADSEPPPERAGTSESTATETADNPLGVHITEEGKVLGTVAYMSPEQAEGKPADLRSDIFSFGVLLYAMSTGRRPFQGDTSASTIASILRDSPPPVTDLKRELPPEFGKIVRRCLEKEPSRRYQSAADLRIELEELRDERSGSGSVTGTSGETRPGLGTEALPVFSDPGTNGLADRLGRAGFLRLLVVYGLISAAVLFLVRFVMIQFGLPGWVVPGALVLLLIGLPILAATAFVQSSVSTLSDPSRLQSIGGPSRRRIKDWLTWKRAIGGGLLAFALGTVVTVAYITARDQGIGPAASLVSAGVLEDKSRLLLCDFENSTEDPTLESAMRQALSIDLSQSSAVRMVPASEVEEILRRMETPIDSRLDLELSREVALRGGIPVVLTGDVTPAGAGVVLSVRLVAAEDGATLTGFRESAGGPDEIIESIDRLSKRLRGRIGESFRSIRESPPLANATTHSLVALQKYSEAIVANDFRGDTNRAITLLEEATAIDSTFAMAHRKLGIVLSNSHTERDRQIDAFTRAYRHRNRLSERERYFTEASYFTQVTREPEKAIVIYRRLLDGDPHDHWALNNLAILYQRMGREELALEMYERAYELENSPLQLGNIVSALYGLGHEKEAIARLDEYGEKFPVNPANHYMRAGIEANLGNHAEAMHELDELLSEWPGDKRIGQDYRWWMHALYGTTGRISEAHRLAAASMAESIEDENYIEYWDMAMFHAGAREIYLDDGSGFALIEEAMETVPLDSFPALDFQYSNLSMMYAYGNRLEEAKKYSELALRIGTEGPMGKPEDEYYAALGIIAIQEGRTTDALELFHTWRIESREPNDVWPWLGYAHHIAAEPDSAVFYLERYLGHRSFFRHFNDQFELARVYRTLGEIYEERGEAERAVHYYSRLVELMRDADPEVRDKADGVRRRLSRLMSES